MSIWKLPPTKTIPAFLMVREFNKLRVENKRGQGPVYANVKKRYGLTGTRAEVLAGLHALITQKYGDFEGYDK